MWYLVVSKDNILYYWCGEKGKKGYWGRACAGHKVKFYKSKRAAYAKKSQILKRKIISKKLNIIAMEALSEQEREI